MDPTVSVVVPTYNTARYISEAIKSIQAQIFKDFQIIVVDDGSTDNTKEVIEPFRGEIRYIYQANKGRAGARNTGIRIASGKYIAFLDSDDLWTPGKLQKQVDIMDRNPDIDLLFGDKRRFCNDGGTVISSMFRMKGYGAPFFGDPLYVREPYKKLLQGNFVPTGTVIMRREAFGKTGLFNEEIYVEDYEFWLRAALFVNVAYSTELWELERDREGSGSKNLKAVYLSVIEIFEKHEREFREVLLELDIDLGARLLKAYTNTGYFLLSNEKELARECFRKSLSRGFQIKALIHYLSTFL